MKSGDDAARAKLIVSSMCVHWGLMLQLKWGNKLLHYAYDAVWCPGAFQPLYTSNVNVPCSVWQL